MASAHKRVNWSDLRTEYVTDQRATIQSLAKKHNLKAKTVEWHSLHERWMDERKAYAERFGKIWGTKQPITPLCSWPIFTEAPQGNARAESDDRRPAEDAQC